MRFLLTGIFILLLGSGWAQHALGSWQDHFPYFRSVAVDRTEQAVFCATDHAVFAYYPEDGSMERLTVINALSDFQVSTLRVHPASQTVLVGYSNGNLDLIGSSGTTNIPFIKTTSNIIGDKSIYNIHFSQEFAYLACGFGIVKVDINKQEIRDTYILSNTSAIRVNDVITVNDSIYAATETGMYKASANNAFLNDPSAWQFMSSLPDSLESDEFNHLEWFNGMLHVNRDHPQTGRDVFLRRTSSGWEVMTGAMGRDVRSTHVRGNELLLSHNGGLAKYDQNGNQIDFYWSYLSGFPDPSDGYLDDGNIKWIADKNQGLVRLQESFYTEVYYPDGPFTTGSFEVDIQDGVVAVVPGSGWFAAFTLPSVSINLNGTWRNIHYLNNDVLDTAGYHDLVTVAINPNDATEMFVGSLSNRGMFRMKDGQITNLIDTSNSALDDRNDLPGAVYVSGMKFDNNGNLWVVNPFTQNPLSVRQPNGTWRSFYLGPGAAGNLLTDIAIDNLGYKWILVPGIGVVVFNDNGTLNNTSDDQFRLLTTQSGNGGLPSAGVESIAVDKDGEIWLGTQAGIAILFSSSALFDGQPTDAQQILLEQDGNIQVLLESESVTAIEIDDGNRKWLGTANGGAFLMSEDGTEQILAFNTDNSPLLSNVINDIAYDAESGMVYFATEQGLISYKGDATKSDPLFNNVYAYPNPVKPDYYGPIAIKGLARNSYVRITDVAGNVVHEARSEGGLAVWQGTNYNGERVASGVYLVFATDENGKEGNVSKILVITE